MKEVREYYEGLGGREWTRLESPSGALEFAVNTALMDAHLPPKCRVLDIGGGPGRYARWLAERGCEVVLADLSPSLLDVARDRLAESPAAAQRVEVVEADARDLSAWASDSFDAALSLGPFYHLPQAEDRDRAAIELHRVVRPGGVVFAAWMPRQAFFRRTVAIPEERHRMREPEWVRALLETGAFHNDVAGRFSHGYGAMPQEIEGFFEAREFETIGLFASEGLGAGIETALAKIRDQDESAYRAILGEIVEAADDPSLFGLSTHLLYIGRVS